MLAAACRRQQRITARIYGGAAASLPEARGLLEAGSSTNDDGALRESRTRRSQRSPPRRMPLGPSSWGMRHSPFFLSDAVSYVAPHAAHQRRSLSSYPPPQRRQPPPPAQNRSSPGRGGVLTATQVLDYLDQHNVSVQQARTTASHVILRECPLCPKDTRGKADNFYKCYIRHGSDRGGGAYFCHRCGTGGSWYDLKRELGDFSVDSLSQVAHQQQPPQQPPPHKHTRGPSAAASSSAGWRSSNSANYTYTPAAANAAAAPPTPSSPNRFQKRSYEDYLKPLGQNSRKVDPLPMPAPRLQALYSTTLLDGPNPAVLDYLKSERGLAVQTLRKYGVGQGSYQFATDSNEWKAADCVTFPWIMSLSQVERQEQMRGSEYVSPEEKKSPTSSTSSGGGAVVTTTTTTEADESKDSTKEAIPDQLLSKDTTFVTRRIKVRAAENKAWQRMDPPGGGWGLFGWHTIPADAKEIVLTEGEYDAMAVYQATGRPAVSLPNGARSLPVEVLPMLEQMEKIYLWMDNDAAGQEGAESFANKLGIDRTYIVRPSVGNTHRLDPTAAAADEPIVLPKDANEALLKGLDMEGIISASKVIAHESIMTFENMREDVLHEILYPEKYVGTPISSMPGLTNLMQGLRRGELTVLTGATGSGKTTFLGQLSLDLVEQDVNVLWGSFEIKNTRLMHKLLQQFAREPLPTGDASLTNKMNAIADRFEQLPMYFMTFHGGSDVDQVLEAMDYAVYVNDVEHIILDNMQFMVSRKGMSKSFDKYDIQDVAIEKFRQFATDRNVHVTLVCHPRKEAEAEKLTMASIYGSAKATQEADTVLILQTDGNRKYVEVKKNRFNGTLGSCPLHFDRKSCRYSDTPVEGAAQESRSPSSPRYAGASSSPKANSNHWEGQFA